MDRRNVSEALERHPTGKANRRRNLLHKSKLDDFVAWARRNGYRQHPVRPNAAYEVARLEKIDPAGNHPHVVIYRRDRGDHLTTFGDGTDLVRSYIAERAKEGRS